MATLLSVRSTYKEKIYKLRSFYSIWDWFFSLDKFTKYSILIVCLLFLAGISTIGVLYDVRGHAAANITTQLIDDFEQDSNGLVGGWTLSTWPTGTPSGSLTLGPGYNSNNAAYINFTFQPISSGTQEVFMNHTFPATQPQAEEIGYMVKASAGVRIRTFIYDSTGQRFEYDTGRPLEATDPNQWYQQVIKLDEPSFYISGANDGKIHFPVNRLQIVATQLGSPLRMPALQTGQVAIDNVQWMDVNTSVITRDVDPSDSNIVLPPTAGNFLDGLGINGLVTTATLSNLQKSGARWVRRDLVWESVETSPGIYNWSSYDTQISQLQSIGMKMLFIVDYGNSLYMNPYQTSSGQDYGDISAVSQYTNFAKAAAAHYFAKYQSQCTSQATCPFAFEIWNEPNVLGFWYPQPNASQYAALESPAVAAIQSVSSNIPVTTAGLASDYGYLPSYINSQRSLGGEKANALSFHPYRQDIPETVSDDTAFIRSYLVQVGLPLQTWITEWGYTSNANWYGTSSSVYISSQLNDPLSLQAKLVARQLWTSFALGMKYLVVYKLQDVTTSDLMGLIDTTGAPKPAWYSFTTATKYMNQFPIFVGIEPMQLTNLHTLVLTNSTKSQYLLVLWKDGATSQVIDTVNLSFPIQSITDYVGNSVSITGNQLLVNDTPLYVVVNNPNVKVTSTPTQSPSPTTEPTPTSIPTPFPTLTPTPAVDTAPPTVSITFPTTGSTVQRGKVTTITATASDDPSVSQVIFYINGQVTCTNTVTPYICNWSVPGKPKALYTITAKAIDASNYYTISSPINVTAQ